MKNLLEKIYKKICWKIGLYFYFWSIGLKIGWTIERKCWVENGVEDCMEKKNGGKSVQCKVYIEQCSSVCWGSLGVPQFGELLRLSPPEEVVSIVWQGGNFLDNFDLILEHGGFNPPNNQILSGNVNHKIYLLCDWMFLCLKVILLCLNQ